jgi:hypothetical protein
VNKRQTPSIHERAAARRSSTKSVTRAAPGQKRGRPARASRAPRPALPGDITNRFADAFATSPVEAERLTSELLTSVRPGKERLQEAGDLIHWASASGTAQQRRTLIAGFRKSAADLALIHHLARLPREQTAAFIKEYLDDGGSL